MLFEKILPFLINNVRYKRQSSQHLIYLLLQKFKYIFKNITRKHYTQSKTLSAAKIRI